MSIHKSAEHASESIISALSKHDLSESEKQQIISIINDLTVESVEKTTKKHMKAAIQCCGPEADLAHKIQQEMKLKKKALIANLMGPH